MVDLVFSFHVFQNLWVPLHCSFMQFRFVNAFGNALRTQGPTKVTRVFNKWINMSQDFGDNRNKVYKVVLTGGRFTLVLLPVNLPS